MKDFFNKYGRLIGNIVLYLVYWLLFYLCQQYCFSCDPAFVGIVTDEILYGISLSASVFFFAYSILYGCRAIYYCLKIFMFRGDKDAGTGS